MEVDFTPEQEAQLSQLAMQRGTNVARLVKEAVLYLLDEDTRFSAAVREGFATIDRGEYIDEEEMDTRISRMLQS
jgi:predicted transcriptional regulator